MRRWSAVCVVALALTATALADGDPASDTLIVRNVFLPYQAPAKEHSDALTREVAAAYAKGFRVKVAIIASETDLGAIPSLFGKPAEYAKFLGQELATYYVGPLLIVMPAGYGIYDGGRSTAAEEKVLAGASPSGASPDDLTSSAAAIVHRLVAASALKSKDIRPPYESAFTANVNPGRKTELHYAVFDDSGRTRERLAIRDRQNRVLEKWSVPLRSTTPTRTYTVSWAVPKSVPRHGLKFCLAAYDASGNHPPVPSCAPVNVK